MTWIKVNSEYCLYRNRFRPYAHNDNMNIDSGCSYCSAQMRLATVLHYTGTDCPSQQNKNMSVVECKNLIHCSLTQYHTVIT